MKNNVLLSILIPTVVGREDSAAALRKKVIEQISGKGSFLLQLASSTPREGMVGRMELGEVEILDYKDNKEMTIGEKRELLYAAANGLYSLQIDDDDSIADDAISLILQAIKENPSVDCITFRENCMMNGEYKSSNHSLVYEKWQDNFDGYDYVRSPFYKDVIRTDIAKSVPFPHIRYNEDEQWSMAIKPLLTAEIHIDEELYHYIYEPKEDFNTRYGIV